jgi:large subunit ribosomal protein L29
MKFTEIKDLTSDELRKKQAQLRDELFQAKMKHSLGQVGNPIEIRDRRRDLARVLTAINVKLSSKSTATAPAQGNSPERATNVRKRATKTAKRKE